MPEYSIERNPTCGGLSVVMYLMIIGPRFGVKIPWHLLVKYRKTKK